MTIRRLHVGPRLSEVAVHNGVAYLAGQVPEDLTQGAAEQTQAVLASIDRLLAELGTDKTKILMAQIFLRDMNDFALMNTAWDAWVVPGHTPPRATVEAGMFNPNCRVEIVITAALSA
ncbi:MAG TPA: RidA family protein [Burkholderiaceae bacterium]|nr:RidA family protein [Burkholderiaceae bacterium]